MYTLKQNKFAPGLWVFLGLLVVGAALVGFYFLVISPFLSLEHYLRVYQNPTTVLAIVDSHEEYDDDGDTDYRSYIKYTVGNNSYRVQFEDKDKKSQLSSIGRLVNIPVSPEDPSKPLYDLEDNGSFALLGAPLLAILLACIWSVVMQKQRSSYLSAQDPAILSRDILLTIFGRIRMFFFLCWPLLYGALLWRYPMIFGEGTRNTAIVVSAIWVILLALALRDCYYVHRQEFGVHTDTLIDKEIISGDENDSYCLTYRSADGTTWNVNTSRSAYESAHIGDRVQAVYLRSHKKPIFHYNTNGEAN